MFSLGCRAVSQVWFRGERSGLLANSVCFVSLCVLWCSAVFCGCFAGVLWCFLRFFCKKKQFFGVLRVFCNLMDVFCECFLSHFLSERKMHSTALRCIDIARFVCVLVCFDLFCKKTRFLCVCCVLVRCV